MPPVAGVETPPSTPPVETSHGNHGPSSPAATAPGNTGPSFADTLSEARSAALAHDGHGSDGNASPHGGHGGNPGGSPPGGAVLTAPGSDPDPRHFALAGQSHGGQHNFQQVALGLRAYRQQLIASNIANADTPGYKAVDIDFQEAMRLAQTAASMPPLTLASTAVGHLPGQAASPSPVPLRYHVPSQASVDGNTVEMDVERSKFAENALMYEFSLDRVSGHFKMMMELYKNLT